LLALSNTLAEIIGRQRLTMALHLTIFEKTYITRTKKCQKAANQSRLPDDFGRISV
jgi:hypothetical protein